MKKVRFVGCSTEQVRWGSNDSPDGILKVGEEYEVEKEEVRSWHTKYFLKGFPGKKFNSICFEEV